MQGVITSHLHCFSWMVQYNNDMYAHVKIKYFEVFPVHNKVVCVQVIFEKKNNKKN